MMKFQLINDEPVTEDSLGRAQLIEGLVAGVKQCKTPFVIAVNGGWGTGKTSILKCMEHKLNPDKEKKGKRKFPTVWFSPWKFQFEDSPAVSLLQQIRDTALKEKWMSAEEMKRSASKLLGIVGSLAGEIVLKAITGQSVSTSDIMSQGAAFEEKYFEAKQLTSRMQEEFQKAIDELVENDGRLIFFIDDLDRCRTQNALRLLEALKLFFNSDNCVYVVAIDMENLADNLKKESKLLNPLGYLEKIFQMVYTLPPPLDKDRGQLLEQLLKASHPSLIEKSGPIWVRYDLLNFLGHNPRALKHFCNRFIMESVLLKEALGKIYDPVHHIFLQILQHCFPSVYHWFHKQYDLVVSPDAKSPYDKFLRKFWRDLIEESAAIPRSIFERYFIYMPPLAIKSELEDPYLVVTVNSADNSYMGVLCLENHLKNSKIKPGSNLCEMNDLSNTILRHLNFSNCCLDYCNFQGADLSKCDLSNAVCFRSNFKDAKFGSVKAKGTDFKGADLSGINSQELYYKDADFTDAILSDEFKNTIETQNQEKE